MTYENPNAQFDSQIKELQNRKAKLIEEIPEQEPGADAPLRIKLDWIDEKIKELQDKRQELLKKINSEEKAH